MNNPKFILNIDVYDFEKIYNPTKSYVYNILVSWSDNLKYIIYRDYKQFYNLHDKLSSLIKKELKANNLAQKDVPELPEKIIFGRSNIKSVALKRLEALDKYCKKLISLKSEISRSEHVIKFFEVSQDDVKNSLKNSPLKENTDIVENKLNDEISVSTPRLKDEYEVKHDFKASSKVELNLAKGTKVFVLEKNFNGWWFVENKDAKGFVPATILEKLKPNNDDMDSIKTDIPEPHIVTNDYEAKKEDEISVKKANYVLVIEKNFNGFWKVKLGKLVGLVPAVFLVPNLNLINKIKTTMQLVDAWSLIKEESNIKTIKTKNTTKTPTKINSNKNKEKYQIINQNKINTILMNPVIAIDKVAIQADESEQNNEQKKNDLVENNSTTTKTAVIHFPQIPTLVK